MFKKDLRAMSHRLRLTDQSTKKATRFEIVPDKATLEGLAAEMGLNGLRKVVFKGELVPQGSSDWLLRAHLGATVVQPCVITLAPVTTRLEEDISRLYLANWVEPDEAEVEMPEDDTSEPLPDTLDLEVVLAEALALALPLYPRADGAELGEAIYTKDGAKPLSDEDVKPFAGLADLKKKLEDQG